VKNSPARLDVAMLRLVEKNTEEIASNVRSDGSGLYLIKENVYLPNEFITRLFFPFEIRELDLSRIGCKGIITGDTLLNANANYTFRWYAWKQSGDLYLLSKENDAVVIPCNVFRVIKEYSNKIGQTA